MKASFVLTLLALCLSAGAAELPRLKNSLSFRKHRGVLAAAFDGEYGLAPNSDSTHNTSHPYLRIDFKQKRAGVISVSHYGISVQKCIQLCSQHSDRCLAINYEHYTWICHELKSLGIVTADSRVSTCLVNYKDGDDPCNEYYFLKDHVRSGFYYKLFRGTIALSAKECCVKCKEDPQSRCVIWSFNTISKYCYLQEVAAALDSSSQFITGYGIVSSASL